MTRYETFLAMFPVQDQKKNTITTGPRGRLWLTLVSSGKRVRIGRIKEEGVRIVYEKDIASKEKHMYRDKASWNVPSMLVEPLSSVDALIRFKTLSLTYEINAVDVRKYEEIQWGSFEYQRPVPLRDWKIKGGVFGQRSL